MEKNVRCVGWELRYDGETGQPLFLAKEGGKPVFSQRTPLFAAAVNGHCLHNNQDEMYEIDGCDWLGRRTELVSWTLSKGEAPILELNLRAEMDMLEKISFQFFDSWVTVDVALQNDGERSQRIRYINWNMAMLEADEFAETEVIAPSYTPAFKEPLKPFQAIAEYQSDELVHQVYKGEHSPQFYSGMLGVYRRQSHNAALSWYLSDIFPCRLMGFRRQNGQVVRESNIFCPCDLGRGESVSVGKIYLGSYFGLRKECIRQAAASYTEPWGKPGCYADLRDYRVLEVTVGEKLYLSPFPDFDALTARLPEIKKWGFNVIQVMPHFPYPGYSIADWNDIATTYGNPELMRQMVAEAHALDMRVILDISLHGPFDFDQEEVPMLRKSPLLSEHQDWFALHESGKISHTYSRSIDMSNPDYQKHLLESLRMYLRDYHVDGFRLDAQHWNNFPNWDPSTGRRPYEMLMAGMRMIDDIRSELKKEFPDVHFYTESSGILTGRAHDYRYNYDTYWALWGALTPIADQRTSYLFYYNYAIENTLTWPDYAQWYEEMRASMAGNMVIVNHVDSHDYHERTRYVGGQYGRDLYGLDMHRVLFGMVAFLDGGVMSYYGAQRGSEQYYSKILELRSSHDVFRNGEFSATQVETDDPKTIAIFWKNAYEWGIYLGNLEHKAKKVRLRIKDADDLLIFNRYNVIDHLDKRRKVLETTSDALREGVEIELVPAAVHVLEGLGF